MFSRSLLSIKRAIFKDVAERRQIFSICRNNHLTIVGMIYEKLLAPNVLLDYLRPMITIQPTHPTHPHIAVKTTCLH